MLLLFFKGVSISIPSFLCVSSQNTIHPAAGALLMYDMQTNEFIQVNRVLVEILCNVILYAIYPYSTSRKFLLPYSTTLDSRLVDFVEQLELYRRIFLAEEIMWGGFVKGSK